MRVRVRVRVRMRVCVCACACAFTRTDFQLNLYKSGIDDTLLLFLSNARHHRGPNMSHNNP